MRKFGRVKVEGPGAKAVLELGEEARPRDAVRHPGVEESLARSTVPVQRHRGSRDTQDTGKKSPLSEMNP